MPLDDLVFEASFAAGPRAAAAARSAVVAAIDGHVDSRLLAAAELVVSELVTNSVEHAGLDAGEALRVAAAVSDSLLRLEVHNRGATGTIALGEPDLERGGGFGLYLVDELTHAWGVSRSDHTVVWAEVICGPPHAATPP